VSIEGVVKYSADYGRSPRGGRRGGFLTRPLRGREGEGALILSETEGRHLAPGSTVKKTKKI